MRERRLQLNFLALCLLCSVPAGAAQRDTGSVSVSVTEKREAIERRISKQLLLRLVKERSVEQENFGWDIEVVRVPHQAGSRNLLYQVGHGPDPSQVYAWHVSDHYFPNDRELDVPGCPYIVKVHLLNPEIEGSGPEAGFRSGTLTVTWERRPRRGAHHKDTKGTKS